MRKTARPDERRDGDDRPSSHGGKLLMRPVHGEPLRWLPRHGEPSCILEWISQFGVRQLARWQVYFVILILLTVVTQLLLTVFGVPFVGGR